MTAPFDTETALRETAEKLRGMLHSIETHGDGEHPSTVADVARISTALTTTCAEIRQCQKGAIREVSKIPLETILSYLKSLPMDRRRDIASDLIDADARESLL